MSIPGRQTQEVWIQMGVVHRNLKLVLNKDFLDFMPKKGSIKGMNVMNRWTCWIWILNHTFKKSSKIYGQADKKRSWNILLNPPSPADDKAEEQDSNIAES